jgi:hypothetical protein
VGVGEDPRRVQRDADAAVELGAGQDERGATRPAADRVDLDRDDETTERADHRTKQRQQMRRAPERHVEPEEAMPQIVDRRRQHDEHEAQARKQKAARARDVPAPLVGKNAPGEEQAHDDARVDHQVRGDPERVAADRHVPLDVPREPPRPDELGG